jgi:hypothetical protein
MAEVAEAAATSKSTLLPAQRADVREFERGLRAGKGRSFKT